MSAAYRMALGVSDAFEGGAYMGVSDVVGKKDCGRILERQKRG